MARTLNNILLSAIIALLTWSWSIYITHIQWLSLLSAAATTALYIVLSSKSNISAKASPQLDGLAIHIATSSDSMQLIEKMLQYYLYDTTSTEHNCIVASKDNSSYLVYCHNSLIELSADDIPSLILTLHNSHADKLSIIASRISPLSISVLDYYNIKYTHINMDTLYQQLYQADLLPKLNKAKQNKKGIVASYALNKHRSKHYAISSIFLIAISSMSYIPVYTLLWATALLVLSLYSRFNKRYNSVTSNYLEL